MTPPILYLSPHPDDVIFSCGGSLALDSQAGPVTLVTAFTRPRSAAARLAEDRAAAAILGCRHHGLDLPAAADRPEVRGGLDAFAPLGPQHLGVASELVARLRPLVAEAGPGARLYAPLGVGGHSDHRLCFVAARALADSLELPLSFYEDQPYGQAPHALARRLALLRATCAPAGEPPGTSLAGVSDAAGVAAQRRFLLSLPGLLPGGLCRPLLARRLASAQWHHDRPSTLAGAPPVLAPRLREVGAARDRHLQAIAAYASQWPRYAASPEALYAALLDYGARLRPRSASPAPALLCERLWDAERKPLGAARVT